MTDRRKIRCWVAQAVMDGWNFKATYPTESIKTALTLSKEGYTVMVLLRSEYEASLKVWDPADMAIEAPETYSMGELKLNAKQCSYCKAVGVTVRIGFAGRCCPACRETHAASIETRGWDN